MFVSIELPHQHAISTSCKDVFRSTNEPIACLDPFQRHLSQALGDDVKKQKSDSEETARHSPRRSRDQIPSITLHNHDS